MTRALSSSAGPFRAVGTSIKAVDHGKWFTIARAHSPKFTPEGNQAVAVLLAAAPEMLDLLRKLTGPGGTIYADDARALLSRLED